MFYQSQNLLKRKGNGILTGVIGYIREINLWFKADGTNHGVSVFNQQLGTHCIKY